MLQAVSPIRDIIHDYIALSDFEAEIVDSRYFQRLHFVWQNSSAFTVYPCNKNSRFVHSLGVAHLCGRIFIHSLRNSESDVLFGFLIQADKFIKEFINAVGQNLLKDLVDSWQTSVGNRSRFRHNDLSMNQIREFCDQLDANGNKKVSSDPEFIVNTLWLSLKIAALCHDIGHLPMSHEFEKAISDLPDASELFGISDDEDRAKFAKLLRAHTSVKWEDCFATMDAFTPNSSVEVYSTVLGVNAKALKGYLQGLELHERRSVRIIDEIRVGAGNENTKKFKDYRSLLFRLATAILLYDRELSTNGGKGKSAFLRALKDILSSQLDADRIDYVARDPKSSGLETGVFD